MPRRSRARRATGVDGSPPLLAHTPLLAIGWVCRSQITTRIVAPKDTATRAFQLGVFICYYRSPVVSRCSPDYLRIELIRGHEPGFFQSCVGNQNKDARPNRRAFRAVAGQVSPRSQSVGSAVFYGNKPSPPPGHLDFLGFIVAWTSKQPPTRRRRYASFTGTSSFCFAGF